jgi:hypothetical protein
VHSALKNAAQTLSKLPNTNPGDRGAFLYMKAIEAMKLQMSSDKQNVSPVDEKEQSGSKVNSPSQKDTQIHRTNTRRVIEPAIEPVSALMNPALVVQAAEVGVPDWTTNDHGTEARDPEWNIGFSESVQHEIRSAISTISGMPSDLKTLVPSDNTLVEAEYEKIRKIAQEATRFKNAGEGIELEPASISSAEDVLARFDEFDLMLKG